MIKQNGSLCQGTTLHLDSLQSQSKNRDSRPVCKHCMRASGNPNSSFDLFRKALSGSRAFSTGHFSRMRFWLTCNIVSAHYYYILSTRTKQMRLFVFRPCITDLRFKLQVISGGQPTLFNLTHLTCWIWPVTKGHACWFSSGLREFVCLIVFVYMCALCFFNALLVLRFLSFKHTTG